MKRAADYPGHRYEHTRLGSGSLSRGRTPRVSGEAEAWIESNGNDQKSGPSSPWAGQEG